MPIRRRMRNCSGVQKSPSVAIGIVLARMRQKDDEWRKARKDMNKIWREVWRRARRAPLSLVRVARGARKHNFRAVYGSCCAPCCGLSQ